VLDELRREWHLFRDDAPGERFRNHERRSEQRGRMQRMVYLALGLLLLVGGVILLFIPGPGLLLILFGAALFAGESRWLAAQLDRAEPVVRRHGHRALERWRAMSLVARAALIALVAALAVTAAGLAWLWYSGQL
jgi:uncharacterized membrane protein YbaN (DUF454 family)